MRRHAPAIHLSADVLARLEDAEGDDGLTLILGPDGDEINLDAKETKNLAALLNGGTIRDPDAQRRSRRKRRRGGAAVKCPKCGKPAKNLRGLEVHIARMHKEGAE